jgi:hypothetical protein
MRIFSDIEKKESKKVLKNDIIVLFVYLTILSRLVVGVEIEIGIDSFW